MGLIKCKCKNSAMNFQFLDEKDMPEGFEASCCEEKKTEASPKIETEEVALSQDSISEPIKEAPKKRSDKSKKPAAPQE